MNAMLRNETRWYDKPAVSTQPVRRTVSVAVLTRRADEQTAVFTTANSPQ